MNATYTDGLRTMDMTCRMAIEDLRTMMAPFGIEPTTVTPGEAGWITVHLDDITQGSIDRYRMVLHFAGAIVTRNETTRHYEAKIEGHVANATKTIRLIIAEFRKMK